MSDTSKELTPQVIQRRPLPGYWHFAWMSFMQPVKLHHSLLASGVERPDASLLQLWTSGRHRDKAYRSYTMRGACWFLICLPFLFLGMQQSLHFIGVSSNWVVMAFIVASVFLAPMSLCISIGVSSIIGLALGVVVGSAVAVSVIVVEVVFFGVTEAMADNMANPFFRGVGTGISTGLFLSAIFATENRVKMGSTFRFFEGLFVMLAVLGFIRITNGVEDVIDFIALVVFVAAIAYFRLFLWPIEFLTWRVRLLWRSFSGGDLLMIAPLWYHELSYLPFPGLRKALMNAAEIQADTVEKLLDIAERVPGQLTTEARVKAELWARTMADHGKHQAWAEAVGLEGRWLPDVERAGPLLLHFRDVSRHAVGAQGKLSASERVKGWQRALDLLASKNLPPPDPKNRADAAFAKYHAGSLAATWRAILAKQLAMAQAEADKLLPNPFDYTALPLGTQESDAAVFLGREEVIAELQRLLTQPQAALGILGPRRVGKSSLLRRLPVELPDDVFVYFDLQDNPVSNPAEFFAALAKRFEEAVLRLPIEKRNLPRLQEPSTMGVAAWFEALDGALHQRVVFCIDEYERLETLWSGDDKSLLQFMGLLRATIQHRRWVRVLIAGSAGPEELGRLWTDHFISVQEVRLDFLTEEQTLKLLCQDTPGFPGPEALPLEIGRSIYRLTSGQPFLTQVFGFLLVQALNEDLRRVATEADVAATRVKVLKWATNYLADERLACEQRSTETLAAIMALAKDEPLACDGATRRWLRLRGMINEANQLRVELFKDYLRRRLAEEG